MVRVSFPFYRRARVPASAKISACGSPAFGWKPRPTTLLFWTRTQPTWGLGAVVSAVTVWARSKASFMYSRSSAVARYLNGALRIDGTSPCAATRGRSRMPACAGVLRCYRGDDAKLSPMDGALSVVVERRHSVAVLAAVG